MAHEVTGTPLAAGIALATVNAGPLFTLPLVIYSAFAEYTSVGNFTGGSLLVIVLSVPFGAIVALIPNTLGAAAMAWAGNRFRAARHPAAWAIVGAMLGALIGLIAGKGGPLAGGWTGASCALLCRIRLRWAD